MGHPGLSDKASAYLRHLCLEIESRRVGSAGNRAATDFFAGIADSFGFEITTPPFDCVDWVSGGAGCAAGGDRSWDEFFLSGPQASDDFMAERATQQQAEREAL